MMNHKAKKILTGGGALGLAVITIGLAGCGGEEPVVAAPRAPRASAPTTAAPVARLTSVSDLMSEMGIDSRVILSEDKAPDTTDQRKAVLEFMDGFARGDAQAVGGMMTLADQFELDQLVETGEWKATAEKITEVYLETGQSPFGQNCLYAIMEVGDTYQPQLWYYTKDGADFVFEAVSAPPNIMNRLYGLDHIDIWHKILDEETELANTPDESVNPIQVVVGEVRQGGGIGPSGDGPATLNPGPGTPRPAPGRGIPGPSPGGG